MWFRDFNLWWWRVVSLHLLAISRELHIIYKLNTWTCLVVEQLFCTVDQVSFRRVENVQILANSVFSFLLLRNADRLYMTYFNEHGSWPWLQILGQRTSFNSTDDRTLAVVAGTGFFFGQHGYAVAHTVSQKLFGTNGAQINVQKWTLVVGK